MQHYPGGWGSIEKTEQVWQAGLQSDNQKEVAEEEEQVQK